MPGLGYGFGFLRAATPAGYDLFAFFAAGRSFCHSSGIPGMSERRYSPLFNFSAPVANACLIGSVRAGWLSFQIPFAPSVTHGIPRIFRILLITVLAFPDSSCLYFAFRRERAFENPTVTSVRIIRTSARGRICLRLCRQQDHNQQYCKKSGQNTFHGSHNLFLLFQLQPLGMRPEKTPALLKKYSIFLHLAQASGTDQIVFQQRRLGVNVQANDRLFLLTSIIFNAILKSE